MIPHQEECCRSKRTGDNLAWHLESLKNCTWATKEQANPSKETGLHPSHHPKHGHVGGPDGRVSGGSES